MAIDLNELATAIGQLTLRFLMRKRTAANWTSMNEVLYLAEWGYETDTKKLKIGDGVTAWASLDYVDLGGGSGVQSIVAGAGVTINDDDPQNPIISASDTGGGGVTIIDYGDTDSLGSGDANTIVYQRLPVSVAEQMKANAFYFAGYTLDETTGNFVDSGPHAYDLTPAAGVIRGQTPITPITTGHSAQAASSTVGIGYAVGAAAGQSAVVTMLVRLPATTNLYGEFFKLGDAGGFSFGFNNGGSSTTSFTAANSGRWLGIGQNGIAFRSQIYNFGTAAAEIRLTVAYIGSTVRVWIGSTLVYTSTTWGNYGNPSTGIRIGYGEGSDVTTGVDIDDVAIFTGVVSETTIDSIIGIPTNTPVGIWNGTAFETFA